MTKELRIDQYEKISRAFVDSFNHGADADVQQFLDQFSASVEWYDHAFFQWRQGSEALVPFRKNWLTSIKDFRCDIKSIRIVEDGAVIQTIYNGTMVGPLPRRKASGKSFVANVLIILKIDNAGKIQKVDEYYTSNLDESRDVNTYILQGTASGGAGKL